MKAIPKIAMHLVITKIQQKKQKEENLFQDQKRKKIKIKRNQYKNLM